MISNQNKGAMSEAAYVWMEDAQVVLFGFKTGVFGATRGVLLCVRGVHSWGRAGSIGLVRQG